MASRNTKPHFQPRISAATAGCLLLPVILVAAFLRLHRLDQLPPALFHDEAYYGWDATHLLRTGQPQVFYTDNTGREPLHIYLLAGAISALGARPWTLRLVTALSGLLAVPLVYRLGRDMFADDGPRARWVGLLGATALAVSYWPLHFSRVAFRAIHLVPLTLLAVWLFWRAWQRPIYRRFALSGAVLGVCLYTYLSARLFPLVLALFILPQLIALRKTSESMGSRLPARTRGSLIMGLAAGLVFAPLGLYFVANPATFVQRSQHVSLLFAPGGGLRPEWLPALAQNAQLVARMFFDLGDLNPILNLPGRPALDVLMALGFASGLLGALLRLRHPPRLLLLIWLVVMLMPSVLSDAAPHFLRTLGAVPAVMLLVGDGLLRLWDWVTRAWRPPAPWRRLTLLIGVAAVSGGLTYYDYFGRWANLPTLADTFEAREALITQTVLALSRSHDVALPLTTYNHPSVLFILQSEFPRSQPWSAQPASRPLALLLPEGLPPEPLLLLHRAPDGAGTISLAPPLRPEVVQRPLAQSGEVLRDAAGVRVARIFLGQDDSIFLSPPQPEHALSVRLGDQIRLIGYTLQPAAVRPGEGVQLTLFWECVDWISLDYNVFVHLNSTLGELVRAHDNPPLHGVYLTSRWHPGEVIPDTHTFLLGADTPPGKYQFEVGLYYQINGDRLPLTSAGQAIIENAIDLGPLTVADPTLDLHAMTSADARLGSPAVIQLLGYALSTSAPAPGQTLEVTLYWRALQLTPDDYTVFIHLVDQAGRVAAQADSPPMHGRAPTSLWSPAETLKDPHTLSIPPDLAPGRYTLSLGLYDWRTGMRLPMTDGAGLPLADNRFVVPEPVQVSAP